MKGGLAFLALLLVGCGSRTSLSTRDAAPFVDDDPFLKIDSGSGSTARPSDAAAGGSTLSPDGSAADGPRASTAGAEAALRTIAKLLWQAEPDPRHLALAQAGQVRSSADLQKIVSEMLQDPRARVGVGAFFRWWLHLDDLKQTGKDPQLFPLFPKVVDPLIEDVVRFGVGVTLSDGHFSSLMTSSRPYEDMSVGALVGDGGNDPRRQGLLGRPGLLALYARPERPSPVKRGLFIRRDLLCDEVPPNPVGFGDVPPQPVNLTNREHYASLMSSPACHACHSLMDDIGNGLENFDAVGAFRYIDHGRMVDSSGIVRGTSSGDLTFNGLAELGKLLSGNSDAQQCIVSKWYQFLRGMPPQPGDAVFAAAQKFFGASGGDMREVIVAVLGATPI